MTGHYWCMDASAPVFACCLHQTCSAGTSGGGAPAELQHSDPPTLHIVNRVAVGVIAELSDHGKHEVTLSRSPESRALDMQKHRRALPDLNLDEAIPETIPMQSSGPFPDSGRVRRNPDTALSFETQIVHSPFGSFLLPGGLPRRLGRSGRWERS